MLPRDPGWVAEAVAQGAIDLRKAISDARNAGVDPTALNNHGEQIGAFLASLKTDIEEYLAAK